MSAADVAADSDDLPDEVATFGGNAGSKYHRTYVHNGEQRVVCGLSGRNLLVKERALIETHYEPCGRCFPDQEDHA